MNTGDRKVVSRAEWLEARKALLSREKAYTRERDAISAARRALPMVKVEKRYTFEEASGTRTLADLFDDKRSSSSITSCSIRAGTRAARAAR